MATTSETTDLALLDERSWGDLLNLIDKKRCTPVVGPEASFGSMSARAKFARA